MLIRVRYSDNTCGIVDDSKLETLINSDGISAFRRADGWAILGRDRIRERPGDRRRPGRLINIYV